MKSPDWIQELYLKEIMHKSIKSEKTHDENRRVAPKTKRSNKTDNDLSRQVQPQASDN